MRSSTSVQAYLVLGFVLLLAGVLGFQVLVPSPKPPALADTYALDGFRMFDSPREFDVPGSVFRYDPEARTTYRVGAIGVQAKTGAEAIPQFRATSRPSLGAILSIARREAVDASASGAANIEWSVAVSAKGAFREFIEDADFSLEEVRSLLQRVGYRQGNKYYLVRETISATEIDVLLFNAQKLDVQVKAALLKQGAEARAGTDGEASLSLTQRFSRPMRVWYKAESLVPSAMGAVSGVPDFAFGGVAPAEVILPSQSSSQP